MLKIAFLKVGIYCDFTVFFHFIPYSMSCTALVMYHMLLKHHETMPLSRKSFDVRYLYILVYTMCFVDKCVYTGIYRYIQIIKVYTSIY